MKHESVLVKETIELLAPQKNENFIDATLGFGGHASAILEKTSPNGKLLGIDRDEVALLEAENNLSRFGNRVTFIRANFTELGLIIRKWDAKKIDGLLLDLGTSNYQLQSSERGFSFLKDAPLDMRMDPQNQRVAASDIVNKYSEKDLRQILFQGEEKFAKIITQHIIEERKKKSINTTFDLVEIIKKALPPQRRFGKKTHFATDTFRALRMAVNHELENLENVLPQSAQILSPGGRLAIITFHSLEDRIVKNFFNQSDELEVLTKKPIVASLEELKTNQKARSAKLRVAKKLANSI